MAESTTYCSSALIFQITPFFVTSLTKLRSFLILSPVTFNACTQNVISSVQFEIMVALKMVNIATYWTTLYPQKLHKNESKNIFFSNGECGIVSWFRAQTIKNN